jgi:hypothetical protein
VRRVYIGIDYSDARSPTSRLRGLQVFEATVDEAPQKIETPAPVRFWPFDGFDVPQGQPLVAELYPSLFRCRYPSAGRSPDEHDAWSVAACMRKSDHRGTLARYLDPPLTPEERSQATPEGWI